jgi:hypothetical protein
MKKIETLYEIRLHCSSLGEYSIIRERLLKTNLVIFYDEKGLFIQSDHLTWDQYNRIKKIANFK